jgi:hypothetical protein
MIILSLGFPYNYALFWVLISQVRATVSAHLIVLDSMADGFLAILLRSVSMSISWGMVSSGLLRRENLKSYMSISCLVAPHHVTYFRSYVPEQYINS